MPHAPRRTSTRALGALLGLVTVAAAFSAAATAVPPPVSPPAAPPTPAPAQRTSDSGIIFPLVGAVEYWDNYGDSRANGAHAGIDMMAPRRAPVLAAENGRVRFHTTSWRAGCMLYLYGKSGTTYLYIHLNNDLTLRNDNRGKCVPGVAYAPDLKDGANVKAGEQIAWNGDSGDADGNPHLHFEVHPKGGRDVNPMPYLKRATRLLFPGGVGASYSLGLRGSVRAVPEGGLELAVSAVRWWPNGRWTKIDTRPVEVGVDPDAVVDPAVAGLLKGSGRKVTSEGATVTVFTSRARITREAQRGEPRAIVASRITKG